LGVISAVITVFSIQELSNCRKFLRARSLRLNVIPISAVYLTIEYHLAENFGGRKLGRIASYIAFGEENFSEFKPIP